MFVGQGVTDRVTVGRYERGHEHELAESVRGLLGDTGEGESPERVADQGDRVEACGVNVVDHGRSEVVDRRAVDGGSSSSAPREVNGNGWHVEVGQQEVPASCLVVCSVNEHESVCHGDSPRVKVWV